MCTACKWIIGKQSDVLFYPDLNKVAPYWSIPINSSDEPFLLDDFYTIRASDTSGIKWVRDSSDNRCLIGKFIKFSNGADTIGNFIPDSSIPRYYRVTLSWRTTGGSIPESNPFYLLRIFAASDIYPLNNEILTMGKGIYINQITVYFPINSTSIASPIKTKASECGSGKLTYYNLSGQKISAVPHNNSMMLIISRKNRHLNAKKIIVLKRQ